MPERTKTQKRCYQVKGLGADLTVTEIDTEKENHQQGKRGIPIETIVVEETYTDNPIDMFECLIRALAALQ